MDWEKFIYFLCGLWGQLKVSWKVENFIKARRDSLEIIKGPSFDNIVDSYLKDK